MKNFKGSQKENKKPKIVSDDEDKSMEMCDDELAKKTESEDSDAFEKKDDLPTKKNKHNKKRADGKKGKTLKYFKINNR